MSSKVSQYFVMDAVDLAKEFAENKVLDLNVFADMWSKHHFPLIFRGQRNFKELKEFTNVVLRLSLELFMKDDDDKYERMAYLYLLYALFRYQPLRPRIKARLPFDYFDVLKNVRNAAERDEDKHTLFALRYMMRNGFDFVHETTLMGPIIGATARDVDLSVEPPAEDDDSFEVSCKIQEDLETCFQELKIAKKASEASYANMLRQHVPYSLTNNIPYQTFLDSLEPYPPKAKSKEEDKEDSIGNRRALIKAAAYSRTISRAHKSVAAMRETSGKGKVGRPKKVPEEKTVAKDAEPRSKRGQKRERLFKKKYMFQFSESTSKRPPSPQPGCSKDSR